MHHRRSQVAASALAVALAAGCEQASPPAPAFTLPDEPITFNEHVAPIVFENCSVCHRPGAAGPFDLLTYEDVRRRARQIVGVTTDRFMPPWMPEPGYGPIAGERRLTERQIAILAAWVEQGAAEGDPADLPPTPQWAEGWQLGEPDLFVRMPEPYNLPAEGPDVFRNFVIPVPVNEGRYVQSIEFQPDNARIIHHADIRLDRTSQSRQRDDRDPEPGFVGMDATGSAQFPDGALLGWTPGKVAARGSEDLAWRLPRGSDLVLGLHMLPSGKPESIQAGIGLYFTDEPPQRYPYSMRLGSMTIDIPAGAADYAIEDSYVLPVDVEVVSVYPHAHYLGDTMKGWAELPDGTVKWLIRIDDWDFNWQDQYWYGEPIFLPRGTTLRMRYTYDNSAANTQNPTNPPRRVVFGGRSSDEMGDLWLTVVPRSARDLEILKSGFERKEIDVRIAGLEKKLEADPDDFESHNDVALLYLRRGMISQGVQHFEQAVRLRPDFGGGYYNIGLVLASQNRHAEAIDRFRQALDVEPDLADAHNAWGNALIAQNRVDAAAAHYRMALDIDPCYARAHYNLGAIARARGRIDEAIARFEAAVDCDPDLARAHETLGLIELERGAATEAVEHLRRAAYLQPDSADAYWRLGQALIASRRSGEAVAPLREAVRLEPEAIRVLNDLAWILATHPDPEVRNGAEALEPAQRAAELTRRRDPQVLDTLAAAYAAAGRYGEAIANAQKALQLAPDDRDLRAHLDAYLESRPFLDPALE